LLRQHGGRTLLLRGDEMLDASARGAWEALVERLDAFIARRLPREEVADLRQEVLLRIHTQVGQLTDQTRFGPWVYSIARNAVIDRLRRKRIATVELMDMPAPEEAAPEDSPLLTCVTPFVARLPEPYREAITLTEVRGLTQLEAAGVVGVSLSGMKSRVQRGRRLLRAMLEECCALTVDRRGRVIDSKPRGSCAPGCS
jgi:RNA polymerase sigma-70 factor (ECF subfamily)